MGRRLIPFIFIEEKFSLLYEENHIMINLKVRLKKKGSDWMGESVQDTFQFKGDSYFLIDSWTKNFPWMVAGFTSRASFKNNRQNNLGLHVGDDEEAVLENRRNLAEAIHFPLEQWVCAEQVHGNDVKYVSGADAGKGAKKYSTGIPKTDGLYTDQEGLLLALAYADCVPIYFFEPKERKVGIVHAGWRGTVKGIAGELIKQWVDTGVKAEEILVVIGPSICKDCYIVDNKVIQKVEEMAIKNASDFYQEEKPGQFSLDLKGLNAALIRSFGVPKENIEVTNFCTSCHSEFFYSHRKSGGNAGRMLAFIGIRGNTE